jgi:hypothetical protein
MQNHAQPQQPMTMQKSLDQKIARILADSSS